MKIWTLFYISTLTNFKVLTVLFDIVRAINRRRVGGGVDAHPVYVRFFLREKNEICQESGFNGTNLTQTQNPNQFNMYPMVKKSFGTFSAFISSTTRT